MTTTLYIPFLDTHLHRMEDGIIQTSVCRKPTHTDRYLDYMSHHPIEHKKAVVQTLYTRAERLSSTPNKKSSEVKHIFNALKKNGYPKQLIQRHFKALQSKADVPAADKDDTITVVLPYVKGVSEAMRRKLARANIRTTFRPCYTTVLTSESNFHRRLTLESWYIHKSHQTLNRENGGLPVEYTLLMKKHA